MSLFVSLMWLLVMPSLAQPAHYWPHISTCWSIDRWIYQIGFCLTIAVYDLSLMRTLMSLSHIVCLFYSIIWLCKVETQASLVIGAHILVVVEELCALCRCRCRDSGRITLEATSIYSDDRNDSDKILQSVNQTHANQITQNTLAHHTNT